VCCGSVLFDHFLEGSVSDRAFGREWLGWWIRRGAKNSGPGRFDEFSSMRVLWQYEKKFGSSAAVSGCSYANVLFNHHVLNWLSLFFRD